MTVERSVPSTGGTDVDRTFVTPHFSVDHDEIATDTEIPGKTVERFGLNGCGTLAAPAGKQLVLLTLRSKAGGIHPKDTTAVPTVTVHAGDRSAPITRWPTGYSLGAVAVAVAVVVVVGEDEVVTLQVEDDGRTVVWGLREGTAAFTLTPPGGAPVASLGTGTSTSAVEVDIDGATSVFQVPADFTAGTVAFQPQATIQAFATVGAPIEVTWATRPPAVTVPLDLTA